MNRKGYLELTLLVLSAASAAIATGTANADQAAPSTSSSQPETPAVPNIPPELANPPDLNAPKGATPPGTLNTGGTGNTPSIPPSRWDSSMPATPPAAAPNPAAAASNSKPTPSSSTAQGCTTPDCASAVNGPGDTPRMSKPLHPAYAAPAAQHAGWPENPGSAPARNTGGRMVVPFSESAPTVMCSPDHICDMELQPGERVLGAPQVGDEARWKVSPALSGSEDRKTIHLIIKPVEAGLDTNLLVPTDRRTYHVRLVSSFDRYVSSVGFFYPDDPAPGQLSGTAAAVIPDIPGMAGLVGGDMPTVAVDRLNFDYKIKVVKGKPLYRPLRVMDDEYHTFIAMNDDLPQGEAPALIAIGRNGQEQMINYRLKGNIYVIDGTVYKLALIAGVGSDQQRIELQRRGCTRRGWLGMCRDPKE